ncbi:hypothetical protein CALVIDRAFT_332215 [Calocera viscosa TUFC12733]|uniref:Uncharacterized protein n=1 Tax=Calocera viscosa (strain TUFC12733) TaxID=1330018 RepID=A0A167HNV2_CALVF|nr:hypothetical protein CALVIDRAFT_332215 [Calocera viscosa TUFC12733]
MNAFQSTAGRARQGPGRRRGSLVRCAAIRERRDAERTLERVGVNAGLVRLWVAEREQRHAPALNERKVVQRCNSYIYPSSTSTSLPHAFQPGLCATRMSRVHSSSHLPRLPSPRKFHSPVATVSQGARQDPRRKTAIHGSEEDEAQFLSPVGE